MDLTRGVPQIPDGVTHVVHCAATVGGLAYNRDHPFETFTENSLMLFNVMQAVRECHTVKHVTLVGSACAYPLTTPVPYRELDIWFGLPEPSNGAYGISKQLNDIYANMHLPGVKVWNPVLANMYGPGDNFGENGHVIPQVMARLHNAKENKDKVIRVMGDGSPTRDFLYVDDAVFVLSRGIEFGLSGTTNVATAHETSIKTLVDFIARSVGYHGEIEWGTKMDNGQPRRVMDTGLIASMFETHYTPLQLGLTQTYAWWRQHG